MVEVLRDADRSAGRLPARGDFVIRGAYVITMDPVLGDMPGVSSKDLDSLIDAFRRSGGRAVVRAAHQGKRGNPVLLPRSLFPAIAHLEGDTGARHLVEADGLDVIDVEIGHGASIDVDTREALEGAGGVLQD